jgi:hypothetical protein
VIAYFVLITAICIYEIVTMAKKGQKKELGLFLFFAVVAYGLAWLYSSKPYEISISDSLLSLLGVKH